MFINIKTELSNDEIDGILSSKICYKYPRIFSTYNLGINWVSNNKKYLCLFYEDGTEGRWEGTQSTVKSFFYGMVLTHNGENRVIGVICTEIKFILLTILLYCLVLFCGCNFIFERVFGLVFLTIIVLMFNINIRLGNKKLKEYIERIFDNTNL